MQKIGVWNYYEALNKENYLLLNKNAGIGDDLLEPFCRLYSEGKDNNIDFMTLDLVDNFNDISAFIFFDFPNMKNKYVQKVFDLNTPKFLVIFESILIKPDNWDLKNHQHFSKVFTWNKDLVDNEKYFHLPLPQRIKNAECLQLPLKKKLCTLIAGNKSSRHPLELYSKRIEAIRYFENNHPNNFDLYGVGWNQINISNKYLKLILNKFSWLNLLSPTYKSYVGKVESKNKTLANYKFSICYENARDIPGYITEKIFDCFFAGCIPIYWGANDIAEYVPENCFIDKRNFDTYDSLYEFIESMSDKQYQEYLNNIIKFLNSDKILPFGSGNFCNVLINHSKGIAYNNGH
ncbi:glycosyltransferase family 10 domain-containing protein [Vibrio aestuarianus]|uniref:Glycosyltransferase family 10 n=1 Tax=Vibrio aestuarianus TaxID=28171 RepID=A0ABD7YKW0_9VIBR|nr:glycosyltransferase family 10 [Vibrio aestuarianus]WGK85210.1 glycosyltransferase family 10 [Vibrio aestuarianus]CAH8222893.1 conserved hypothetical protein [Vibrio aestuarianus]